MQKTGEICLFKNLLYDHGKTCSTNMDKDGKTKREREMKKGKKD
jgi:hypothetical protein